MKSAKLFRLGSIILITLCLTAGVTAQEGSPAEKPSVQAGIDAYIAAYRSRDADRVMDLYDPGLGDEALALHWQTFERLFEQDPDRVEFEIVKVVEREDGASALLTIREEYPEGEAGAEEKIHGHLLFFQVVDGTWRIADIAERILGEAFDSETRTYRSKRGLFSLQVPEDWIAIESPRELQAVTPDSVTFIAPDLASSCVLGFVQLPMKISAKEGVRADVAAAKRLTTKHELVSEGPRSVGELDGYEAVTEFEEADSPRRRRMRVYLSSDPILYFFIFDAIPPEKFGGLRAAFESILDSFTVLPPEDGRTMTEGVVEEFGEGAVHDRVYTSDDYNCFIAAPEGWEIRTSPNPGYLVEMKYTGGNSLARLLGVKGVDTNPDPEDPAGTSVLQQSFEERLKAVKALVEDFTEVSRKDVTIQEAPGILSVQTYSVEGLGKFHVKEITVVRDGVYYLVLCQAVKPDSYEDLEPDFDRIIASFGFIQ